MQTIKKIRKQNVQYAGSCVVYIRFDNPQIATIVLFFTNIA